MKAASRKKDKSSRGVPDDSMVLTLYVSGMSGRSMLAIKNVRAFCDEHIKEKLRLEIVDLYKNPELASENQVIFSPCLIKTFPLPRKVIIGTFSDVKHLINVLGIKTEE